MGKNTKLIRSDIRISRKIGHSIMQRYTELGEFYGSDKVAYDTFRRWGKEFWTGIVRQRCSLIWPTCDC